ncbi:cob(I)yrinic acid a,c-diamide adenosyltransferase [Ancylomarina sp. 16SWW S1-10-2]|uniref:cob(I)yrinic acid a,c-diamide adenosyltransferase n=1 Tax=Ancylomarina sp. 16SWW S1-10-2 TaxID=2499681 RepID=UPI0012AE0EAD|nr:cob(I)yrinic acid a,c-diamide adenosyltransferase [Ancylomarina sp. 16SWW S1-10-2]MRT94316.1 cob(I)yrinic acid a,c-diamide adenosyltransferase [Ancylomarina sp. 16SWW S1-10-2]
MKGYIHVYTGNGKGKTTAAFGLALRAIGAGKKVYIGQFVKGLVYSEVKASRQFLPNITVEQYGIDCFIEKAPTQIDIDVARKGLEKVSKIISSAKYDVVILDEATIAIYFKLFSVEELIELLKKKPDETEIIITGRYAPTELIEIADLVSEMKEIKHYYTKGVEAREGIEC